MCQSVVRSEAVWPVHINSKQHRENVERARKLKEKTHNFTKPLKRPLTPPHEVPTKKPKGILKNGTTHQLPETEDDTKAEDSDAKGIPADFFDSGKPIPPKLFKRDKVKEEKMEVEDPDDHTIPEGFFDDPKLDAKVRYLLRVNI